MKFVAAGTYFDEIMVNVGKVREKYAVLHGNCILTQNVF